MNQDHWIAFSSKFLWGTFIVLLLIALLVGAVRAQKSPDLEHGPRGQSAAAIPHGDWQIKAVEDPMLAQSMGARSLALDALGRPHVGYQSLNKLMYASPASCVPLEDVAIAGPTALPLGVEGRYSATYTPPTATVPLLDWADGQQGETATYSWDTVGVHTVAVTASNECSQVQDVLSVTVFCQPPTGVEIAGPPSLLPGLAGTYRAAARPITTSPPLTFTWDNGALGSSAGYSWPSTGTYTLTVTATNDCGQARGSFPVRVLAEWPHQNFVPLIMRAYAYTTPCEPVHDLDFSWQPLSPTVGQAITLSAGASGSYPISYQWDLGDGGWRAGAVVTHSYDVSGTYRVLVTATNCGTAAVTSVHTLTVVPSASCVPVAVAGFSWQPPTPTAGQVLTLSASAAGRAWFSETIASANASDLSLALDPSTGSGQRGDGNAHLGYFAGDPVNQVAYAHHDGTSWSSELVADAGLMGGYTDLALDAPGRPHLSYYDDNAPALRHAYYSGTAWIVETADSNGYYGNIETSLALDGSGTAHISSYDEANGDLRYARYDGASWQVEVVDAAGRVGRWGSLALDGAGQAHISYSGDTPGYELRYAYHDGVNWITETVAAQGIHSSLALDGAGRPHLAYQVGLSPSSSVVYAHHNGASWIIETVAIGEYPELSLDAAGRPHLVYVGEAGQALQYIYYDGTGWVEETAAGGQDLWGVSLALDAGRPRLAYYDATAGQLRYAHLEAITPTPPIHYSWDLGDGTAAEGATVQHSYAAGGSYRVLVTATNCGVAMAQRAYTLTMQPALCEAVADLEFSWQPLDPAAGQFVTLTASAGGTPPISYSWSFGDGGTAVGVTVTHSYAASGTYGVVVTAANCGPAPITASHVISVCECQPLPGLKAHWRPLIPTSGQPFVLSATVWPKSPAWLSETVEAYVGPGTPEQRLSLALDSKGQLHLAFYDSQHQDLVYSRRDVSAGRAGWERGLWFSRTVDWGGNVGRFASLALDDDERPHISYYDATNLDLRYAHFDGMHWITETADPVGYVGGYTSLALDSSGQPHIAYYDHIESGLRYVRRFGANWIAEVVDDAGWLGKFPSLLLDDDDQAHISYYAALPTQKLKYAVRYDTMWAIEVVDSEGNVGQWNALVLAPSTGSGQRWRAPHQLLQRQQPGFAVRPF
ncbi:MAG: PKD domain-containing protein [Chloroflexia bacterium]|nr:PKD domain-containing protein [Chloroflexia bacterium]